MNPLSARVPLDFTVGQGLHAIETSRRGRGTAPSFVASEQTVAQMEPVTFTLTVPSMTSGTTQVLTATQGLKQIVGVVLGSHDTGQVIFTNLSSGQVTNAILSHPTVQLQSAQGNPAGGVLATGQTYSGLGYQVSVTIYATGTVAAGTLTITGTALLLGQALGD